MLPRSMYSMQCTGRKYWGEYDLYRSILTELAAKIDDDDDND